MVAVADDPALRGLTDPALLSWTATAGRVIATYDVADFLPLFEERLMAAEPMAGIILISPRSYPPGERGHGRLLSALAAILREHRSAKALAGKAIWLASE